jgi:tRNA(fMet)-specific endonuclease VapC
MSYLLDTCVLSELVAPRPIDGVVAWFESMQPIHLYISVVTLGEIKRGIEKLPAEARRKQVLRVWLEEDLLARFQGRILGLDAAVMLEWGRLVASVEQQGRTLPLLDSLMAAQALYHRHDLVTRNVKDFAGSGVHIFNPWE